MPEATRGTASEFRKVERRQKKKKRLMHAVSLSHGTDMGHVPLIGATIAPKRSEIAHVVRAIFEAGPVKIWAKAT